MNSYRNTLSAAAVTLLAAMLLSACAGSNEQRPGDLASSKMLTPDKSIGGAWLYRSPEANFSKYRTVMFDRVNVYQGPEANFGDASTGEKQRYAELVGKEMQRMVGEKYHVVTNPGPEVMRIRPTLIGVRPTVGGVATITRVIPMGAAINIVRGAAGAGGTMTGGIELAVEFYDSVSNKLLAGAVRQITPGAFDIEATLSTEKTVESSGAEAGTAIREAMDRNIKK